MKSPRPSSPVIALLALMAGSCATERSRPTTEVGLPADKQVIEFQRRTLVFEPTRDDITVGCAIVSMYQSDMGRALPLEAIRVNGRTPRSPTLYLKPAGKNRFELPAMRIEFSTNELGSPLYLALKVWFNELTNQEDSPYYEGDHLEDRYALLSYCSNENEVPAGVNARLGGNRARTLTEFKERLAMPIVIRLNQRPLQPGHGHWPMINNAGRQLSEADLKVIEQLMRDRHERFLIAINAMGRNGAYVGVGDHDIFQSARDYELERDEGTWRIKKVETVPEGW